MNNFLIFLSSIKCHDIRIMLNVNKFLSDEFTGEGTPWLHIKRLHTMIPNHYSKLITQHFLLHESVIQLRMAYLFPFLNVLHIPAFLMVPHLQCHSAFHCRFYPPKSYWLSQEFGKAENHAN